ncbi:hypothetical protein CAPTEDRAFT_143966 [Capitella teleta]|nr:hypothetical protein CAPTEDRAFT_143966 [Capitella teleta]|eukprot:ELU01761.1 hypothetical protein CAPTEDRAFT_143966 [Capitella teleta]
METRKVASSIPVTEIPYVMRAMGFYPSEQEIEDMLNEIKFSDYVETGKYKTSVDMGEFIQLYINHRPAFGLQPDKLAWAFETLGVTMDGLPFLDRSELLHLLQNRGEHMTEYQLAEYLTTLLGFNAEGGSSELQDFDTEKAGQLIDENLPYEITADMFANELLGFGMYSSDVLQVEGESQSPPSAQVN